MKRPKDYVGERALDKVSVDLSVYDIPLRDVGYEAPSGRRLLSVDCSTVALMRGHNYGVYLLRVAYAFLEPPERRRVNCDFQDHIVAAVGDSKRRRLLLRDKGWSTSVRWR